MEVDDCEPEVTDGIFNNGQQMVANIYFGQQLHFKSASDAGGGNDFDVADGHTAAPLQYFGGPSKS